MASISTDRNGNRRIFFSGPNRKRKIIYLGGVPMKTARTVKGHVENLAAALLGRHAPDPETSAWVGNLDDVMHGKLAAVGLVLAREPQTGRTARGHYLGCFHRPVRHGADDPEAQHAEELQRHEAGLLDFFGAERQLATINAGDCDDWRANQVGPRVGRGNHRPDGQTGEAILPGGGPQKIIPENPMQDVKAAPQDNKSREYFVTVEETEKIIASCPDAEWRLIVALARYGGLRTPSETFALTWGCVDWERSRVRIISPKTECHAGRDARWIPLFPELRPYLEAVYDAAPPGTIYVISGHRLASANLRTQLLRIMDRAGVKPWPRLFQNMRASRETELSRRHPLHVVTAWIGNSAPIAARHYLQVNDTDFDAALQRDAQSDARATQKPTQQLTGDSGTSLQETQQALENQGLVLTSSSACDDVQMYPVPPGESNPCSRAENPMSWATRRRGPFFRLRRPDSGRQNAKQTIYQRRSRLSTGLEAA